MRIWFHIYAFSFFFSWQCAQCLCSASATTWALIRLLLPLSSYYSNLNSHIVPAHWAHLHFRSHTYSWMECISLYMPSFLRWLSASESEMMFHKCSWLWSAATHWSKVPWINLTEDDENRSECKNLSVEFGVSRMLHHTPFFLKKIVRTKWYFIQFSLDLCRRLKVHPPSWTD